MSEHLATAGIIIASIAVILTVIGIIISGKLTRDSNKITMQALEETKRSTKLEYSKSKPQLVTEHASYELHEDHFVEFKAKLINKGEIPASNIRYACVIKENPFGLEVFLKNRSIDSDFSHPNILPTLAKDETQDISETEEVLWEGKNFYVGLWFRYDFLDEKDHQEIHFHNFPKGVSPHYSYKIHHGDIEGMREK